MATLDNALGSHDKFTLSKSVACQLMADVWHVAREWRVFFESFGVSALEMDKIAPAFRNIDDVSTSGLRKLLP